MKLITPELPWGKTNPPPNPSSRSKNLAEDLLTFTEFGKSTQVTNQAQVPVYINEFWTSAQRQASSLHEISYRACFKPQLPRFFIERLTHPGDIVYDPFMGRGTTPIEAALLGRIPYGNDINPLSQFITRPRLRPPQLQDLSHRLGQIPLNDPQDMPDDLLAFFHPKTLEGISSLKHYFLSRHAAGTMDALDEWLAMVSLNRLTGHSNGFFSVYTLPPNQAVSVQSQRRINEKRNQVPPERDIKKILLKKSRQLLGDVDVQTRETLATVASSSRFITRPASSTPEIPDNSVHLVVTSPPFLNVVQYAVDNWLRCWFLGIDADQVQLTVPSRLEAWQEVMTGVFHELRRVLCPGGHVAFEVGEVHGGRTKLEEAVLPCGVRAGLEPVLVMINDQEFTKTANCWGVANMSHGTNTNRIVVFRK